MNIVVRKGTLIDTKTQAIILPLCEGENQLLGIAAVVDRKTDGLISDVLKSGHFKAKPSQVSVIYAGGFIVAKQIALVGLGQRDKLTLEGMRSAYARVIRYLRDNNIRDAATSIDWSLLPQEKEKVVVAIGEGAILGQYQYTAYRTVGRDELKEMRLLEIAAEPEQYALVQNQIRKTKIITAAVCLARDLASAPANEMTPTVMAAHAQKIAARKKMTCRILEKGKMKALGMNALLGVASGSHQPPKFIILEYAGGKKGDAPIALVGKGLTFDSGGISIKPAEKMDEMKTDMSGGAAVMAVIMAAADLSLPCNLVALIAATENMPGGNALKPGDILKSYSGQTIEVLNTDAEGRLTLADVLFYAQKYKPKAIIDVATLTGACVVALGEDVIGMFGTDEQLKKDISRAAQATGELVWELPLWEHYFDLIKSDIADLKNTAGRMGGAITGAAFLSKFVGNYPWVHLDIAGPAWTTKDKAYIPKGASGVTVRLLIEYLQDLNKR